VRLRHYRNGCALLLACAFCWFTATGQKTPPPAGDAQSYPAMDAHAEEHVAVAADPLDTHEKEGIFKIDYLKAGYLPVRLVITNSGDSRIKLDQVRVYFVTADGEKVKAAEPEDVERRIADPGNPTKAMVAPFPLRGLMKPRNKDPKVEADFKLADFADLVVAPHETQSGYLFFDISGYEAPLAGAKLLVRGIQSADGTELFAFEAPFDKYLARKAKP
jgi:hypothetical protein